MLSTLLEPSAAWETTLQRIPRVSLAQYPTPLEFLPRISAKMGREIYVKRDDVIGPGLGGNKTRKLEYLFADALQKKTRRVVTFGGLQSNHARITAAAAVHFGMEPHLFYFEPNPQDYKANLYLNKLLGADMHFIPFGGGGGMSLETTIRLVHTLAWLRLGPHYFIPVGGHNWLGCLGYVQAALELNFQAKELGLEQATLVVAAGSGGTLAGLMAGLFLAGSSIGLIGIDVGKLWKAFPTSISHLATDICHRLGRSHQFIPHQVPLIEGKYVGSGYGKPSTACLDAIRLLAEHEGLLLDPIYTAKAFAGMLDMINQRDIGDGPLIFLHTGGLPAIFAFDGSVYY